MLSLCLRVTGTFIYDEHLYTYISLKGCGGITMTDGSNYTKIRIGENDEDCLNFWVSDDKVPQVIDLLILLSDKKEI